MDDLMSRNDLISRQEVETVLMRLGGCDATDEFSRGWDSAITTALREMNDVPSAPHSSDSAEYINRLTFEAHKTAQEHGWWLKPPEFGTLIALCHSELSEALEEYRNGRQPDEVYELTELGKATHFDGIPIELADVIIRIMDMCGYYDIDLGKAIVDKMAYNKTRTYKHGGKVI